MEDTDTYIAVLTTQPFGTGMSHVPSEHTISILLFYTFSSAFSFFFTCVCVCVRACVRACVCVCVRARVYVLNLKS